jgi:hypothetical protein
MQANIKDLVRPQKKQSTEMQLLNRRGAHTLSDVIQGQQQNLSILLKILKKDVTKAVTIIGRMYKNAPIPAPDINFRICNRQKQWINEVTLTPKMWRDAIFRQRMGSPKIVAMNDDTKNIYFSNLSKIVNVPNKSKMLRLLQGDVYCGERLVRFGLSENDTCKRCFQKETIIHLLMECPYTCEVYTLLGIKNDDMNDILGVNLNKGALEIRSDLLGYIVFRQHVMPPEILIRTTLEKFAKGLVQRNAVVRQAKTLLNTIFPP